MKALSVAIIACFIISVICEIQYFQVVHGNKNTSIAVDVQIRSDESILFAGNSDSFSDDGATELVLSKFTREGYPVWTTVLGFSGAGNFTKANALTETTSGIFVVGERFDGTVRKGLIAKFGSDGSFLNQIDYADEDTIFYDVVNDGDDVVVVGETKNGTDRNGIIVKVYGDASKYAWVKQLGSSNYVFSKVTKLGGPEYAVVGKTKKYSSTWDLAVQVVLASDGSPTNSMVFLNATSDVEPFHLIESHEGSFVIGGRLGNFPFMMSYNGTMQWEVVYEELAGDYFTSFVQKEDKSYLATTAKGKLVTINVFTGLVDVNTLAATNQEFTAISKISGSDIVAVSGQYTVDSRFLLSKFFVGATSKICGLTSSVSVAESSTSFTTNTLDILATVPGSFQNVTTLTATNVPWLEPNYLCKICETDFTGDFCNETTCYGIANTDSSVCKGHGDCRMHDKCECHEDYYGQYCNITSCFGFLSNSSNTSGLCGNHGTCVGLNKCDCDSKYHSTNVSGCVLFECNGVISNESSVCGGADHGYCDELEKCVCVGNWSGTNCESWKCWGVDKGANATCNGHGKCNTYNNCTCDPGYWNDFYGGDCVHWKCGEYYRSNSSYPCFNSTQTCSGACSNNGTCVGANQCKCDHDWLSETKYCSTFWCYGKDVEDADVCNGDGSCVSGNNCQCKENYFGTSCSTEVSEGAYFYGSFAQLNVPYRIEWIEWERVQRMQSRRAMSPSADKVVPCSQVVNDTVALGVGASCKFTTEIDDTTSQVFTKMLVIAIGQTGSTLNTGVKITVIVYDANGGKRYLDYIIQFREIPEEVKPIEGDLDAFTIALSTGILLFVLLLICLVMYICCFFCAVWMCVKVYPFKEMIKEKAMDFYDKAYMTVLKKDDHKMYNLEEHDEVEEIPDPSEEDEVKDESEEEESGDEEGEGEGEGDEESDEEEEEEDSDSD